MERIGRYEILRELGRGGFGRVYLANDPSMNSEVAIKVMSNADDPEMLARFRVEAAAARKLRHESIVTIYDVGEMQGVPYIVMEYMQGLDLQKIREQNVQLMLVQKVRILSQVAAGLQVAHENGVIHRDVKPANIMILKDGSVKIMDFGIARLTREGATHHTRTGVVVGTLHYIPPEQFEGHAVDTMSDLWAFGVIAYQLFSGKNPFDAAETVQVIYNITSLQIPDLQQINPAVPEDLCRIVRKLLTRDRSARYQAFEDVRVDLNPVLEGLEALEANRLVDDARVKAARGDLESAHSIVKQVLERHPSNTQAKQIRDHIVTQRRAKEVAKQVEDLLKKGDQDMSTGSYGEALNSYRQASRLSPANSTARMKMERAQQLSDRVARIREEMNKARAQLAAGRAKEAIQILSGILADDPAHAEAPGLLYAAQQEQLRLDGAARDDAILFARHMVTQGKFAQAREALTDCARKVGDHAALQQVVEEVSGAEATAATNARIEAALASASERVSRGEFAAASMILAPLAAEFPAHPDIVDLLNFAGQEEARVERVKQQLASATPPHDDAKPERARVIDRALEMSRERQRCGQIDEAIHVLDVALSRYPDAAELVNERSRLLARKPAEPERVPGQAPQLTTKLSNRRFVWGLVAAGVLLVAGLGYFQFRPAPSDAKALPPTKATVANQERPVSLVEPSSPPPSSEVAAPVAVPAKKSVPPLASLLPPRVPFLYRKGDSPSEKVLRVERSPIRANVTSTGNWLAARVSDEGVVLSLKAGPLASLAPGRYAGTVHVTSDQEDAAVEVTLVVEAVKVAVAAAPPPPVVTPAASPAAALSRQSPPNPEPPKTAAAPTEMAEKKRYNGPKSGRTVWSGSLAPGARLVLGDSGVIEGGGVLTEDDIPTTDVKVDSIFPTMEIRPPAGGQRIVIVNSTGAAVRQIRITWSVK